jgi:O-antigen/teichoic acid export membrane protein
MGDDLAAANINRTYTLSAMSIAIFTFLLIFLYPRFVNGEVNGALLQAILVVMGLATFSFVASTFQYYGLSAGRPDAAERERLAHRGDRFWLLGYTLLFLAPSLVLVAVGLLFAAAVWFALWLVYLVFAIRWFPRRQAGT